MPAAVSPAACWNGVGSTESHLHGSEGRRDGSPRTVPRWSRPRTGGRSRRTRPGGRRNGRRRSAPAAPEGPAARPGRPGAPAAPRELHEPPLRTITTDRWTGSITAPVGTSVNVTRETVSSVFQVPTHWILIHGGTHSGERHITVNYAPPAELDPTTLGGAWTKYVATTVMKGRAPTSSRSRKTPPPAAKSPSSPPTTRHPASSPPPTTTSSERCAPTPSCAPTPPPPVTRAGGSSAS